MIFWIDKDNRKHWKSEINDQYLMNIANGLMKGIGHTDFCTAERIDNIFEECYLRGLMTSDEAHEKCMKAIDAMIEKREREAMILDTEAFWQERLWSNHGSGSGLI